MSDYIVSLHWIYTFVMLAGALTFLYLSRNPRGVPKYEYVIATIIPLWSGAAYLSIALGQGILDQPDKPVYFARYLDWVVTTPLLLLALALTAMYYEKKKDKALIGALIASDVFMILTGLIADFSSETLKYVWYVLGLTALAIILYIVWYPLRKIAIKGGEELKKHYQRSAAYLTVFWVCYPTAWFIGPSGVGWTQHATEITAFIVLPILSKIGFSLIDVGGLRRLKLPGVEG